MRLFGAKNGCLAERREQAGFAINGLSDDRESWTEDEWRPWMEAVKTKSWVTRAPLFRVASILYDDITGEGACKYTVTAHRQCDSDCRIPSGGRPGADVTHLVGD